MSQPRPLNIYRIFALLCLAVPLAVQGLWIYAFNTFDTQSERLSWFLSWMPGFLKDPINLTLLSMGLCLLCLFFVFRRPSAWATARGWQLLAALLAVGILLLNLWSLL